MIEERSNNGLVFREDKERFSLDKEKVETLIADAVNAPRSRARICSHRASDEVVHEMFVAHKKGAYVRPHKHHNKPESLLLVQGHVDYLIFDDTGNVVECLEMADYSSRLPFYQTLRSEFYHSLIIRSEWVVFFEVTRGPFQREDTLFAPWSPGERDANPGIRFLEEKKREFFEAAGSVGPELY